VLLRGFSFTKESFIQFSDACCPGGFSSYVGGGFRFRGLDRASLGAGGTLLSTTGHTQAFGIPLHGEMYYQRERPDVLWFFCERAPAERGQTTMADGRDVLAAMSEPTRAFLRANKLRYVRELGPDDWPTTFQTSELAEVRRICERNGMTLEVRDDQSIHTEYVASALTTDPGGREVFLNNALMLVEFEAAFRAGLAAGLLGERVKTLPLVVRMEDGSPVPEAVVRDIEAAGHAGIVDITWRDSDVVMVDNRRVLHGRRKTVGTDRSILVRLGSLG
jgi:hypothetical protein